MAKKFNLENPATQFISTPLKEETLPEVNRAPEGYKINPMYIEKKSKRVQLLMQPSLYSLLKARATEEGKSVNDMLHSILEKELKEIK